MRTNNYPAGTLVTPYTPQIHEMLQALILQHGNAKQLGHNLKISPTLLYRLPKKRRFVNQHIFKKLFPTIPIQDFNWYTRREFNLHFNTPRPRRERLKLVQGQLYKFCNGKFHNGQWLPIHEFYLARTLREGRNGKFRHQCKKCDLRPDFNRLVPRHKVDFIFTELIHRLGPIETARRTGMGKATIYKISRQQTFYIRISTIEKAMHVLQEVRAQQEVRHKDSISHGAAKRGKLEKPVTERKHLYKPHGDDDAVWRRNNRRNHTTEKAKTRNLLNF